MSTEAEGNAQPLPAGSQPDSEFIFDYDQFDFSLLDDVESKLEA